MDNTAYEVVSFWRRAAALFIDLMIINLVIISNFGNALNRYLDNITLGQSMKSQISLPSEVYIIIFIIALLALFYFTFFEYYLGQTIGDMIFRIRTVSLRKNSGKISLWSAAVRNCYILPFFPFYIFWIVEPLYLAFYKERFLEKITFTKVIMDSSNSGRKMRYKDYKLEKI
jgi:uncharacterized RDD family membrane protein YckC